MRNLIEKGMLSCLLHFYQDTLYIMTYRLYFRTNHSLQTYTAVNQAINHWQLIKSVFTIDGLKWLCLYGIHCLYRNRHLWTGFLFLWDTLFIIGCISEQPIPYKPTPTAVNQAINHWQLNKVGLHSWLFRMIIFVWNALSLLAIETTHRSNLNFCGISIFITHDIMLHCFLYGIRGYTVHYVTLCG